MRELLVILILVLFLLLGVYSDNLNWEIGDHWKYEVTMRLYMIGSHNFSEEKFFREYKVVGIENVTFYGKSYYAYRIERQFNDTISFTSFYRVGDLADIGG